jgi:hypothetical protein
MSLKFIRVISELEKSDEFHMGRLIVLLNALSGKKNKTVEGIMKLAKLDFFLRYPNCLERALKAKNIDSGDAKVKEEELNTIESKMIRFKYGPWDDRYRRWINILVAKDLAIAYVKGNTVHIGLTDSGKEIALGLISSGDFDDLNIRSTIIAKEFGKTSATKLKEFVYEVFPEIVDLKWGEKITL